MDWIDFILLYWRWWLEIAILSLIFYSIYRLIHGTRSASVLGGLALVISVLWIFAKWLDLVVLNQLFQTLLTSLPILLVVLLQQEIRQGLAGLSLGNFFARNRNRTATIEAIVGAVESLSDKRIGALIAIQHTMSNQGVVESGVLLNATATEELIETLFYPKTPLHDGCAWIENDKIVAAACILPVTQRESLHRSLGLRHRAALGLSEECDAIVVVVSEETGIISLCHKGVLERPLSPDQLRQRITDILLEQKNS
jgi:diadenylate cyclase